MDSMAGGISGTVKSWNGNKGFGFIDGSALETDVMFSRNELPDECKMVHGKFLNGRSVMFQAHQGPDGRYKATSVSVPYAEGWPVAGRIKSYSEKHGYGFIVSNQLTQDVRFDRNSIDASPGSSLVGQLVVVEIAPRPDGKLNAARVVFQDTTFSARSHMSATQTITSPGAFSNGRGAAEGLNSMVGIVKMYNFRSGTGYLTVSGYAGDVVFNATDPNILVGGMVSFNPLNTDGRLWANNVLHIPTVQGGMGGSIPVKRPVQLDNGGPGSHPGKKQRTETSTGQYAAGSVKNYNEQKGFGFIQCDGLAEDIFFMRTWLPPEYKDSTGSDLTGASVNFELLKTPDGKYRAQNITFAG